MKLSTAIRLEKNSSIALVGAGGKTTALLQLAQEMQPAIVTTTTHIGAWQIPSKAKHLAWQPDETMPPLESLTGKGITVVTGILHEDRFSGLENKQIEILREYAGYHDLPLLIEADGARQRPLKAPGENEPVIPSFVDLVVVLVGLSGFTQPLAEKIVHRPEVFSRLTGLDIGSEISMDALTNFLVHPSGGLKNIPTHARRIALLNQADLEEHQALGKRLAQYIKSSYDSVVISALDPDPKQKLSKGTIFAVYEETAGVILAAGGSTRYGQPKQLLQYRGKTFVRSIAEAALAAGLNPVIIVTGSHDREVGEALGDLPIKIVHNPLWQEGQSTSIKAGVAALPFKTGAAIFLLADQPQVSVNVLRALAEKHSGDLPSVLAPFVNDRRANPVLFDRRTFAELMKLEEDQGGRAIFSKFSPAYLDWADKSLLLDVDTPEDYHRLVEEENDL